MSNVLRSFKRQNTPHNKHRAPAPGPRPAGFPTIGHTFTPPIRVQRNWRKGEDRDPATTAQPKQYYQNGERVDVVRPWSWVKAIHRHNVWQTKKNNEFLKTTEVKDEV